MAVLVSGELLLDIPRWKVLPDEMMGIFRGLEFGTRDGELELELSTDDIEELDSLFSDVVSLEVVIPLDWDTCVEFLDGEVGRVSLEILGSSVSVCSLFLSSILSLAIFSVTVIFEVLTADIFSSLGFLIVVTFLFSLSCSEVVAIFVDDFDKLSSFGLTGRVVCVWLSPVDLINLSTFSVTPNLGVVILSAPGVVTVELFLVKISSADFAVGLVDGVTFSLFASTVIFK
uniref:Uncharacterized protein n=1 Tax=Cacopsylla melanoneura TaxID=428564 RepID=A0A8D9EMT8_9HEMI